MQRQHRFMNGSFLRVGEVEAFPIGDTIEKEHCNTDAFRVGGGGNESVFSGSTWAWHGARGSWETPYFVSDRGKGHVMLTARVFC